MLLRYAASAAAIPRDGADGGRCYSKVEGAGGLWPVGCAPAVAYGLIAASTRLDAAILYGNEESDGADLYTAGQTGHVWLQSLAWGVAGLLRCYQSDAGTDEYGGRQHDVATACGTLAFCRVEQRQQVLDALAAQFSHAVRLWRNGEL